MAVLWFDGFKNYGVETNLNNFWDSVNTIGVSISEVNPKSHGGHLRLSDTTSAKGPMYKHFGYLAGLTDVVVGGSFNMSNLPTDNNRRFFFAFLDTNGDIQVGIMPTVTGAIRLVGSSRTATIKDSDTTPLRGGAYHHIECKLHVGAGSPDGRIEVRVDGKFVLEWDGATDTRGTGEVSYLRIGHISGTSNACGISTMDIDAVYALDLLGPDNNDFIGDKSVYTLFPNTDVDLNGWSWPNLGTISAYTTCNEVTPDDDTDYTFANVGASPIDSVTFGLENLPTTQTNISAVSVVNRAKVEDSQSPSIDAELLITLVSGASSEVSFAHRMDGEYHYYDDVFETDPASGVAFTTSDINSLNTILERVT